MKSISEITFGTAVALVTSAVSATLAISPAFAQEAATQQPVAAAGEAVVEYDAENLTDTVRGAIADAQEKRSEGDTATALTRTQAAVPLIQNDDDRYLVGSELIQVGVAMQSAGATPEQTIPLIVQGAQLSIDSGRTALDRRGVLYKVIGDAAAQAEDYPAAITAYESSLRYAPNDASVSIVLADAYFRSGNAQAGSQAADRAIQMQIDAGQPVDPTWLSVALNAAYEARDADGVARYTAQLVRNNGDDSANIGSALIAYQAVNQFDDQANLDLFRFMRAAGAITQPNVYMEYITTAAQRGLPGEAQAVQNEAITSSAISAANAMPTQAELTTSVNEDRGSLEASASSARGAADGNAALNTADAYAGYGQHDQAIELYQLALQKGGVDAGTVNLRMGAALAAAGRFDEARTAFEAVSGSRAGLAGLWIAWLDHQAGGATASPVPAQPAATEPSAESVEPSGS